MQHTKRRLAEHLKTLEFKDKHIIIGFDGFVDEIVHAVDKRMDSTTWSRIDYMQDFAKRIEKAAGLSTNIELVPMVEKIGGNGPIMCLALAQHQSHITYIGALGTPSIHPVFMGLPENVNVVSIANYGHTDAVEFKDGKLMLGKLKPILNDVNYDAMLSHIPKETLVSLLNNVDLFATVNWSMLPHMTSIWQRMALDILPKLNKRNRKPFMFVDLADPEKRVHQEIMDALYVLSSFNPYFNVVLGLNKKEAYDIATIFGLDAKHKSLNEVNMFIYDKLNIYGVVIHPVDQSSAVIDHIYYHDMGPLAKNPKLTTGAGDNFNAGFMFGLILDLDIADALLLGMATSGFYVRQARSPKYEEIIQFLIDWENQNID